MPDPAQTGASRRLFAAAYVDSPEKVVDRAPTELVFRDDFIKLFEDAQEAVDVSGGVAVLYELKPVTVLRRRESVDTHPVPSISVPA